MKTLVDELKFAAQFSDFRGRRVRDCCPIGSGNITALRGLLPKAQHASGILCSPELVECSAMLPVEGLMQERRRRVGEVRRIKPRNRTDHSA
ncbi:MAG TPA: hypothetical protein VI251_05220 [Pseudolabrys sp.]